MTRSRRQFLAALGSGALAAIAATAGCLDRDGAGSPSPTPTPTDRPPGGGPNGETLTPRSPRALSVSGAWPQAGSDAGRDGATDAGGVPAAGEPYWHLPRVRSGNPVVAGGRLFHYARLGTDVSTPPTRTRTPPTGTSQPLEGAWYLVCRDASDGRIRWTVPLEGHTAGWPAVADGRVLLGARGRVAAVDAASGESVWSHDLAERDVGDPAVVGDRAVVPLSGVVSGESGEYIQKPLVRAYGLSAGADRWTVQPPKRSLGLAADTGTAYVLSWDWETEGVLQALSLGDGGERWRRTLPGTFFRGPVVADGAVYVASSSGRFLALAAADGSERWARTFDDRPERPAVDGTTVYVAHGERLTAHSRVDGSRQWRAKADRDGFRPPAVAGGVVYAPTMGGESAPLLALDAGEGASGGATLSPARSSRETW